MDNQNSKEKPGIIKDFDAEDPCSKFQKAGLTPGPVEEQKEENKLNQTPYNPSKFAPGRIGLTPGEEEKDKLNRILFNESEKIIRTPEGMFKRTTHKSSPGELKRHQHQALANQSSKKPKERLSKKMTLSEQE